MQVEEWETFVTCKIFEELFMRGEVCCCTCPTGVCASHLPQGRTFHSVFKTWTPDLSASNAIDEIQTALATGGIFCLRAINNLIVAGRCILRTNHAQHTRRSIKHIEPWRPPSYHGSHGEPLPAPMRRNISQ